MTPDEFRIFCAETIEPQIEAILKQLTDKDPEAEMVFALSLSKGIGIGTGLFFSLVESHSKSPVIKDMEDAMGKYNDHKMPGGTTH